MENKRIEKFRLPVLVCEKLRENTNQDGFDTLAREKIPMIDETARRNKKKTHAVSEKLRENRERKVILSSKNCHDRVRV